MSTEHDDRLRDRLLEHASQQGEPDVILAVIDTSTSDDPDRFVEPYLILYSCTIRPGADLDDAIERAAQLGNWDPLQDATAFLATDEFDFPATPYYPDWPGGTEEGDAEIIETIRETVEANEEAFDGVGKVFFHHVMDFEFDRIKDEPV